MAIHRAACRTSVAPLLVAFPYEYILQYMAPHAYRGLLISIYPKPKLDRRWRKACTMGSRQEVIGCRAAGTVSALNLVHSILGTHARRIEPACLVALWRASLVIKLAGRSRRRWRH